MKGSTKLYLSINILICGWLFKEVYVDNWNLIVEEISHWVFEEYLIYSALGFVPAMIIVPIASYMDKKLECEYASLSVSPWLLFSPTVILIGAVALIVIGLWPILKSIHSWADKNLEI